MFCLLGDCGKIVIFAIFAKFAAFANCYGPPSWASLAIEALFAILLCALPLLAIVAKLSFSPYLQNSPLSPTFYGPPSLLCALPRWRLWQNCHFRHICQIRRFRQLLWAPFTALCCFASLAFANWGPFTGKIVIFAIFAKFAAFANFVLCLMGPLHCFVLCLVGDCGKIVIFAIFAKFAAFANGVYGPPSLSPLCFASLAIVAKLSFSPYLQIRRFRQLLWAPFTSLCFASLAIVAKLSFSPYLPNSPLSPTVMGPLHCFVLCLVGDCGKIVIFAIFAKFAAFANFYGPPSLLCALPRWRLWQNCHFRHICQIRRWGPFTALCFASLAIVAKLSFSPYLPNSPLSPTFMGPLHCFVLCLVGDCGKIVIFAIFAKFAAFAKTAFMGDCGPSNSLCVLPRWRLWQNCHFRHICQIRRFRQLLWGPLHCFVLCLVGDCGKIVIFAIFAKFAAFANFYGPPSLLCALPRWRLWQNCHFRHICQIRRFRQLAKLSLWGPFMGPVYCFVLCLCWRLWQNCHFRHICKFAAFANFYGPPSLLCALPRWQLWQNCHFRHICQIRRFRQRGKIVIFAIFASFMAPFTALCPLATVFVLNSPPTFMGPLHFWLCLVGNCGKIVIFAIFAKFAAFANCYGPPSLLCAIVAKLHFRHPNSPLSPTFMAPSLLCALPRWRLWQNCHFRHICQIRRFRQLLWGPFTALCFASLAIVAKLSFSPYLPNSPLSPTFMGFAPSLLCALPLCWRLWQNCHFRHICQIRRFRQLLWGPFTALCFASLAIVAKLSFSPYLPLSPNGAPRRLSPTFMGPLYCFVLCLVGDCGKIVIFAIFAKFAAFANFYGAPSLLCALPRWRLWQNCHFRHICQIRRFRQLLWAPFTLWLCVIFAIFAKLASLARILWQNCHFRHICRFRQIRFVRFRQLFRQLLWAPFTALCFASLAIVAKLSFSPYLPNSPLSPTVMGPLHSLCALPRWRLWQNCHFRHICQIRRFRQLLWAPFTALCFASLAIVAKLSFSPYLPNSPLSPTFYGFCPFTALCFASLAIVAKLSFSPYLPNSPLSPTFMGPLHCFVLCLVGDCGKIVIFAIFAKFAAFANFYGAPSLLCALPRWRLWQNCHFRHICQIRRFRQLLWAPFTALCFASLAIVAKLSFSPYLPNSPLSPTFLCAMPLWRLWQNCHFRHIC